MTPPLVLYDTKAAAKRPFRPLETGSVRMYVCGPTVYDDLHLGNARPLVVFDVLFRLLRRLYGAEAVAYIRNITDVDDKIIEAAAKRAVPIAELTRKVEATFLRQTEELQCLPPSRSPRATDHIAEMIRLAEALLAKGAAYEAEGHLLFHVPHLADYGSLSKQPREEIIAGARVDVAPYKKDPRDFVLWKPAAPDEPGWESPWGRGRPGWHLECSAMSEKYLGPRFDIHGGGQDLVFPHHENERAQTCAAHGSDEMAAYWLHNGYVISGGKKMSKSLGNIVSLGEALARHGGEVVRFALLAGHYRQPLDITDDQLRQTAKRLEGLRHAAFPNGPDETSGASGADGTDGADGVRNADGGGEGAVGAKNADGGGEGAVGAKNADGAENEGGADDEVLAALLDDLNTPRALARLHALRDDPPKLRASAALLGLLLHPVQARERKSKGSATDGGLSPAKRAEVEALVAEREAARATRDFAKADQIRSRLAAMGIRLEDTPDGPAWEPEA